MTSIPAGAAQFRNRSFKSTHKSHQTATPHLQSPVASAASEVNPCTISPFQTPSPAVVAPSMIAEDSEDVEHGGGGCGGVGVEECFFSFLFLVLIITGDKLDKNFGFAKNLEDKYELGKEVGRGNFGYTCWAYAKNGNINKQMVAVKIISKDKMTSMQSIEDVRREVRLLKALSGHRHMIKFYDVFEDEDNVFVVTELCEGGELYGRILARGGPYPEADAKRILVQILSATAFFHLQGVVHGDLKPENFLFTSKKEDAILKVIDFGSSNFARIDQRLNDAIASVRYVAPEVLDRSYSIEADIWSIGVISYILLTGYRPFYGRTDSAIFRCVLKANPDFEGLTWPSISPIAKDFVKRLLNKDHRKRMTAAQSLAHPWLRDEKPDLILDFSIYKLVKSYICASPFRRAALKSLSKAIPEEELVFLKAQFMLLGPEDEGLYLHNFTTALTRYATDAMIESRLPDILNMMRPLAHRKLDFEEFCAAAVSVYQLEALEEWEQIASVAFDHFELEGSQVITVQELAEEMSLGPNEYPTLKNWIRSLDGKLTFFGYTKFLLSDSSKLKLEI